MESKGVRCGSRRIYRHPAGFTFFRVMRSKLVLGVADGWLSADGSVIYRASDLKVGLFKQDEALQPSGA